MKTLKAIPYQSGYIFVDESAEIKEGDYYLNKYSNEVSNNSTIEGRKMVNLIKSHPKVIAQHNLNLEGIPYVELEEDVDKLAAQSKKYTEDDLREAHEAGAESLRLSIIEKLGLVHQTNQISISTLYDCLIATENYIQSLQPKIKCIV